MKSWWLGKIVLCQRSKKNNVWFRQRPMLVASTEPDHPGRTSRRIVPHPMTSQLVGRIHIWMILQPVLPAMFDQVHRPVWGGSSTISLPSPHPSHLTLEWLVALRSRAYFPCCTGTVILPDSGARGWKASWSLLPYPVQTKAEARPLSDAVKLI